MSRGRWLFLGIVLLNIAYFWRLESGLKVPVSQEGTASREFASSSNSTKKAQAASGFDGAENKSQTAAPSRQISNESPAPRLREPSAMTPVAGSLTETLQALGLPDWKVWQGMGIAAKGQEPQNARVAGSVSGFSFFEDATAAGSLSQFDVRNPVAIYNERTHKAGVITGTFSVMLKDGVSWEEFASAHALALIAPFEHLRTYMVTSSSSTFDYAAFMNELKSDSRIETLKPEVLSRVYVKN